MPATTKSRPKAKGPPKAKSWKDSEVNIAYEDKAKSLLRNAIKQSDADYDTLSKALARIGIEITPAALENKISRGGFSAAFLLQCVEALKANITVLKR